MKSFLIVCLACAVPVVHLDQTYASQARLKVEMAGSPPTTYSSDCACDDASSGEDGEGHCEPTQVHLRQDREADAGLSLVDTSRMFTAQPVKVDMVPIASTPFICFDDRIEKPVLSTPGGDLGEFVLALNSYNDLQPERNITDFMVETWLSNWVSSFPDGRTLTYCTDDKAVQHVQEQLFDESLDLKTPPERLQPKLLEALTQPENMGDTHFRRLVKSPEEYHVNGELAKKAVKAFFVNLWSGKQKERFRLLDLVGSSNPQAFLEIETTKGCEQSGLAPAVVPRTEARGVIASHLDAVSARREELATYFARHVGNLLPMKIDTETLHQRLDRHGLEALELTGSRLAEGLPIYSLTYA